MSKLYKSKVNTITPVYTIKLGLTIWKTNVGAQKINSFTLMTYTIVIISFDSKRFDSLKRLSC